MFRLDQLLREAAPSAPVVRSGTSDIRSAMIALIDVVSAEPRVSICRQHFEDAVVQFQNRDVERAAAQIVDGDLRAALELVEAVGQRRRCRFIDDALDGEPGEFAGRFVALRCASLKYAGTVMTARETARPSARFRVGFQFPQDQRGYFFGRIARGRLRSPGPVRPRRRSIA